MAGMPGAWRRRLRVYPAEHDEPAARRADGRGVANDGVMMEPYVVESVHDHGGTVIYQAEPRVSGIAVDPGTAAEMRAMMNETVTRGTSRRSFHGFFHGPSRASTSAARPARSRAMIRAAATTGSWATPTAAPIAWRWRR